MFAFVLLSEEKLFVHFTTARFDNRRQPLLKSLHWVSTYPNAINAHVVNLINALWLLIKSSVGNLLKPVRS